VLRAARLMHQTRNTPVNREGAPDHPRALPKRLRHADRKKHVRRNEAKLIEPPCSTMLHSVPPCAGLERSKPFVQNEPNSAGSIRPDRVASEFECPWERAGEGIEPVAIWHTSNKKSQTPTPGAPKALPSSLPADARRCRHACNLRGMASIARCHQGGVLALVTPAKPQLR
jgi:hypothetical protein